MLERRPVARGGTAGLDARSNRIHARRHHLSGRPPVIVASEPMDGEHGWRLLEPGELLHVGPDLTVHTSVRFPSEPAHPLTLQDLDPAAAASQHAHP